MSTQAHEITQAEVVCQTCKKSRWVEFQDRHAGSKRPLTGVQQQNYARCPSCPTGSDYTEWTGHIRPKE